MNLDAESKEFPNLLFPGPRRAFFIRVKYGTKNLFCGRMNKNKDEMKPFEKYKSDSIRLKHYDYSLPGEYFITICTKDRIEFFGKINKSGEMVLSEIGRIAEKELLNTPEIRKNIAIDAYVIMPNHIHAIIVLNEFVETQCFASTKNDDAGNMGKTQGIASLQREEEFKNRFGPQSKNLGSIIRGFKSAVTKYASMNNLEFEWQSGYYEHIIRGEKFLNEIRNYIESNPQMWDRDKNNPKYS